MTVTRISLKKIILSSLILVPAHNILSSSTAVAAGKAEISSFPDTVGPFKTNLGFWD